MLPILLGVVVALASAALLILVTLAMRTRAIARQAERMVPPSGAFVEIDGNRIHFVEEGQGRPIVFVHGLGAQLHHFTATLFPGLAGDFRCIALDRPGSGYSARPPGASAGPREQARVLARFIETLKLEKPLVVAHSLGGAVALALAIDHPETVSGLALIAPLTRHRKTVSPAFKSLYIKSALKRRLLSETLAVPMSLKMADAVLAQIFAPQKPTPDYMVKGGGWLGLRPSHIFATSSDFTAIEENMPEIERRVGKIRGPVGILFGTADAVLDFELDGKSLPDRLDNVEAEWLDGIGHMVQFVEPEETAAFVRRMAAKAFSGDGADDGGRTRTGIPEGF